jgi:hypothetical protein
MLRRLPLRLLLLLTFTVGQWLAVVHATQHELAPTAKADICAICVLGHGNGAAALPPALPADLSSKSAAPSALPAVVLPELRAARARSRAPPLFLA